ncbi:MAG: hypothetical protein A2Y12_09940 [Planctomycetes bacterium GWF2_42_9]|nr:MAG: hypothetical protein A2Y12_09940 [Planctomycetes bacterium GWF2_42_9]
MGILNDISPILHDIFQIIATSMQTSLEKEVKTVKRRFTRWVVIWTYYVFSLLLVLVGLIFLGAALFALLSSTISVQAAALVVGGVIFVLGTVMSFVLIANLMR